MDVKLELKPDNRTWIKKTLRHQENRYHCSLRLAPGARIKKFEVPSGCTDIRKVGVHVEMTGGHTKVLHCQHDDDAVSPEVKAFREKWDEEVALQHFQRVREIQGLFENPAWKEEKWFKPPMPKSQINSVTSMYRFACSLGLPSTIFNTPQRRTNYMNWKAIAFKRPMEVLRVAQLQRKREHFIGQIFVEQGLERPAYYVVLDGGILRFTPAGDARILVPGDACLEQSVVRFYGAIDAQFGEQD